MPRNSASLVTRFPRESVGTCNKGTSGTPKGTKGLVRSEKRFLTPEKLESLIFRFPTDGGGSEWEINCAGSCEEPYAMRFHVKPDLARTTSGRLRVRWEVEQQATLFLRCRKCETCREKRKAEWIARAIQEAQHHKSVWFVTLTYLPQIEARFAPLCGDDVGRFMKLRRNDLTEYLGRVRKRQARWTRKMKKNHGQVGAKAGIRYLVTAEKSSIYHWHLLVYGDVRKRDLVGHVDKKRGIGIPSPWRFGLITQARKLKKDDGGGDIARRASYVAKYMMKGTSRLRASTNFGRGTQSRSD